MRVTSAGVASATLSLGGAPALLSSLAVVGAVSAVFGGVLVTGSGVAGCVGRCCDSLSGRDTGESLAVTVSGGEAGAGSAAGTVKSMCLGAGGVVEVLGELVGSALRVRHRSAGA
ncbi:hypothetical protein ACFQGA_15985 [Marinobacter koreensis]|uniref:hypothetical protein n=1 Tax=Marinobacter koreensis TaxID=335974 RepID=UPI00361BF2F6